MPSRVFESAQAVTMTTVSPYRTVTAPSACFASFPVSMIKGERPTVTWAVCMGVASIIISVAVMYKDVEREAPPRRITGLRLFADSEPLNYSYVPL